MFHYTKETNLTVAESVQALGDVLKEEQFGVLWDLDMKQTLENKGLAYNHQYRVLEVCNPPAAQQVLSSNPMVGYFLPCKIVVYEDQGQTKIGMPRPTVLIGLVEDDHLTEIAEDIEQRLIHCIEKV